MRVTLSVVVIATVGCGPTTAELVERAGEVRSDGQVFVVVENEILHRDKAQQSPNRFAKSGKVDVALGRVSLGEEIANGGAVAGFVEEGTHTLVVTDSSTGDVLRSVDIDVSPQSAAVCLVSPILALRNDSPGDLAVRIWPVRDETAGIEVTIPPKVVAQGIDLPFVTSTTAEIVLEVLTRAGSEQQRDLDPELTELCAADGGGIDVGTCVQLGRLEECDGDPAFVWTK